MSDGGLVGAVAVRIETGRALIGTPCPAAVDAAIVALMVIVTEAPFARLPFHVTVLVPTVATAVPLVALALTRVRLAGRASVNSLPGLSACVAGPALVRTTV